jgi:hypothetical protein
MATDTTRVSSYAQFEGYKDSAGTMYPYASAVNNLVTGLTTAVNASSLVNLVSGLTTSVNASSLVNLVSGLVTGVNASALNDMVSGATVSAGQLNYATSFPASAAYAVSAGTLSGVTATAGRINALIYSTAAHKSVYGSTAITASATIGVTALGLTTLAAFVYTKTVSCIDYMAFATTGVVISLMSGATAATGTIYFMAIND